MRIQTPRSNDVAPQSLGLAPVLNRPKLTEMFPAIPAIALRNKPIIPAINRWKINELIPISIPNGPVHIGAATVWGISRGYTIQEIHANQNPIFASSENVSKSLHRR